MIWGKNLVYRFIIMISRSSLIFGSIEQFLTELCTFDLKKNPNISGISSFSLQRSPREGGIRVSQTSP